MSRAHAWLAERERGVPELLLRRLHDAVLENGGTDSTGAADELATAAAGMLRDALAPAPMTRAQALDVLGADALITYAFEAAADEPEQFTERADAAMRRIAALAEGTE